MSSNLDKERLHESLKNKTDEELVGMAYISVDEYTIEGIECAKAILSDRGITEESDKLQDLLPNVISRKVSEISKPKDLNPISKRFSFKYLIWSWRTFVGYAVVSRLLDSNEYGFSENFVFFVVWFIAVIGFEALARKRKAKEDELLDEKIYKAYSNLDNILKLFSDKKWEFEEPQEIEISLVKLIMKECYDYDTSEFVNSVEECVVGRITQQDRKVLDTILPCISLGASTRYLKLKYGNNSQHIIDRIYEKLVEAIKSAAEPTDKDEDVDAIASSYVTLIEDYADIIDIESKQFTAEYGIDIDDDSRAELRVKLDSKISEGVFSPFEDDFEAFKPNHHVALFILKFYNIFELKTKGMVKVAEDKYSYNPKME